MNFTEIEASIILQHIDGIGPSRFQKLIDIFDSPQQILAAPQDALKTLGKSQYASNLKETILNIQNKPNHKLIQATKREIEYCHQHDIQLICLSNENYPPQLREIAAPPSLLYLKGDISHLSKLQLAIVGSRKASPDAQQISFEWAKQLSQAGIVITSGLAEGIDACAHSGALHAEKPTVAVLAHGLDHLYPQKHLKLSQQVQENGALVTEYAIGMKPQREFFPRRNRIISGLSRGVCIIEAATKSGSLVTAKYALEQNRDIFAMPSHINNRFADGCHNLIKQGASLVTDYQDILDAWSMTFSQSDSALKTPILQTHSEAHSHQSPHPLLEHIPFSPIHFDKLMHESQLSYSDLSQQLMELELKGQVIQQAGLYRRAH